ncbi:hypothetical protein MN608_03626 [Microdochium nivale]|nr:hypothetical protein MN608_03626 [Microdochium nivale]
MLEYFTHKKVKKHKADKEEKERLDQEGKNEAAAAKTATAAPTNSTSPTIVSTPSEQQQQQQPPQSPDALGQRLLDNEDEQFLRSLTASERDAAAASATAFASDDDPLARPPLPSRPQTIDMAWESDASSVAEGKTNKELKDTKSTTEAPTDAAKPNRLSFITSIPRSISVRVKNTTSKDKSKGKGTGPKANTLAVPSGTEADREQAEVERVLNDLSLASSTDNKVFSLSKDSAEVVQRFTQVLKDLTNGVPTAYNDLVKLIEDRDTVISKNFDKLPKGLQKLVTQLPDQLSAKLGPEVLAMAAEAQGLAAGSAGVSMKGAAKQFANPKNLHDLVTKPGAVVSLLKGIVNALKARWPAFIGTNVIWSVAVFLLLSVLWYCYKRGREERLIREAGENPIDGKDRIEELPDDLQLPAPPQDEASSAVDGRPLISPSPLNPANEVSTSSSATPRK